MLEARISGRRPNRSDRLPITGEKKNCIRAKTVLNRPYTAAARATVSRGRWRMRCADRCSPASSVATSLGSTGATMPSAKASSITVMKMKARAPRGGPDAPLAASTWAAALACGAGRGAALTGRTLGRAAGAAEAAIRHAPSAAASRCARTRANTPSNMAGVSRPVFVFSREQW